MTFDDAKEIRQSRVWDLVCNELDVMIESQRGKLELASAEMVKEIQTRIRTLRSIKNLPTDIMEREGEVEEVST